MSRFYASAPIFARFAVLLGLLLAVLCAPAHGAEPAQKGVQEASFLAGHAAHHNGVASLPQWTHILAQYEKNKGTYALCRDNPGACPSERIAVWQQFIGAVKDQPDFRQIAYVNHWVNRMPYRQDDLVYGDNDHWASVEEFLAYAGDCEDFAIMKYMTLREMGFPASRMHITMVYDVYSGTDHAFLVVQTDGGVEYVMDNRESGTDPALFAARYKPHFAFNEKSLRTYNSPVMARTIRKSDTSVMTGNR